LAISSDGSGVKLLHVPTGTGKETITSDTSVLLHQRAMPISLLTP